MQIPFGIKSLIALDINDIGLVQVIPTRKKTRTNATATKHIFIWNVWFYTRCSMLIHSYSEWHSNHAHHTHILKSKIKIMKNNWNQLGRRKTTTAMRNVNVQQHYTYSNSCSITHTHTDLLNVIFCVALNKKRKQSNSTRSEAIGLSVQHFGRVHMYKFIEWQARRKRERAWDEK